MKIAIVTPVFNREKYLLATIKSISQQKDFVQHIIVDGGSTDGSVEIINENCSGVHWWCSERDNGMYDAINKGFQHTDSEIMGWINSDDILLQGAAERIVRIFSQNPSVEWITGLATVIDSKGNVLRSRRQRRFTSNSYFVGRYRGIQQESTFWRRSLWDRVGGKLNTDYRLAADYDLWCRFFSKTSLYFLDLPMGAFRKHGNQLSEKYKNEYNLEIRDIRIKSLNMLTIARKVIGFYEYLREEYCEKAINYNTILINY